jgi:RNA polymerase sigma-70 factor (ECF subfamily)
METPVLLAGDGCVAPAPFAAGFGTEVSPNRRLEFEDVLSHNLPRFRQVAMRHLQNAEDAEDAVQDALLSAFKNLGRFEGRAQMSSWIMAIVINSARIHLRRRHSRLQMPSIYPTTSDRAWAAGSEYWNFAEQVADPTPTAEQSLERLELCELVHKLAQNLPLCQRTALKLRVTDGLSLKEAAEALGIRQGTLKAYIFRGKRRLEALLLSVIGASGAPSPSGGSKKRLKDSGGYARCCTSRSLEAAVMTP